MNDWNTGAQTDHERPLNTRGRKAAPRVAERLHGLGWIPQVVHSSDATRTRQTWELMQAGIDVTVSLEPPPEEATGQHRALAGLGQVDLESHLGTGSQVARSGP